MKQTPLFGIHQKLGGRLIEFGGWEMPVQYTGIIDEHLAVRSAAGIFDISHMGEFLVGGRQGHAFLNRNLTNNIEKLAVGQGQYTLMCNEAGGVIDDLYVYRTAPEDYLLIVNASRIDADYAWLQQRLTLFEQAQEVSFRNASEAMGAVAVQGPNAVVFIDDCFPGSATAGTPVPRPSLLRKNEIAQFHFQGASAWVSRTGYTGEDGFEIVTAADRIAAAWEKVMDAGKSHGLKPAGLGARDTLRTEVCYPLYGHELDEQTTPIEAGLKFFVAFDKGDFAGRGVLVAQSEKGPTKRLIAFRMVDKSAPPRPHYSIMGPGENHPKVGVVTSGTQSPSLGIGVGMGYVPPGMSAPNTRVGIEIRGRLASAEVVKKPIYRKAESKPK